MVSKKEKKQEEEKNCNIFSKNYINPSCPGEGQICPYLGFFRRNFFVRNFSFSKPILRINIFMYYTLWQILKKIGFQPYFLFVQMGGHICPPPVFYEISAAQSN